MKHLLFFSLLFLAACSTTPGKYATESRVVEVAPSEYIVKKGDTLFSISWRYGLSQQSIMEKNNILNPNKIYIGQRLYLGGLSNDSSIDGGNVSYDEQDYVGSPGSTVRYGNWVWPMKGKVLRYFNANVVGANGIRIAGKPNQTVNAADAGTVAYKGSGLKGYGNVVIIKHRTGLLSAYGFLSKIYVHKGQVVKKRQKIGTVGYSPDNQLTLHFEIRKNARAVNPMDYIGTNYHF